MHISLEHRDCAPGRYQSQMKTSKEDRKFITDAAALVGMTRAEFMRTVLFNAACQIHGKMPLEPTDASDVAPKRNAAA